MVVPNLFALYFISLDLFNFLVEWFVVVIIEKLLWFIIGQNLPDPVHGENLLPHAIRGFFLQYSKDQPTDTCRRSFTWKLESFLKE